MSASFLDRKCRLCGHAKLENENIFNTRDRFFVKKIAAVCSIWVTPSDPLPKCICHKCYKKVVTTYQSFSQVKNLQMKWLENVASNDPNNNYVKVLNFIERANNSIKNFVETNYGEKLCKDVIENLLINALSENIAETQEEEELIEEANNVENVSKSNGTNDTQYEMEPIKPEAPTSDDEEEYVSLAEIATNKKAKLTPNPTGEEVKCKYCPLKFESLKQLAEHQVSHLKLTMPKLFQSKCLNKSFRRGRLISVQSRQSIRCLNCYLVFDDNKCILEHWSKAECDFYCQICGEEFAQSPKLLREHVSEVHGISYRSLKMQRDLSFLSMSSMQPFYSKPKQKTEHKTNLNVKLKVLLPKSDSSTPKPTEDPSSAITLKRSFKPEGRIKCRICKRDFRNFKACNSHMRAHKPPYSYNDTEELPDFNTDAYMEPEPEPEPMSLELTPPSQSKSPTMNLPQTCTSSAFNNIRVAYTNESVTQISPAASSTSPSISPNHPLSNLIEKTEPIDMELETIQVNSSTSSTSISTSTNSSNISTNINCNTNTNFNSNNNMVNLPSSSPNAAKGPTTSTAPRGIRMKFVNRRNDLNGSNAIKVKSINDLKAKHCIPTTTTTATGQPQPAAFKDIKPIQNPSTYHPPQHASPIDIKPIQNLPTCPPLQASFITTDQPRQHVLLNDIKPMQSVSAYLPPPQQQHVALNDPIKNQNITASPASQIIPVGILTSIQSIPTCPPLTLAPTPTPHHHTSVIVNSLQNQAIIPFSTFEPPIDQSTLLSTTVKDEPMEFI